MRYLILIFLVGCGTKIEGVIDPAFISYAQDFELKMGVSISSISISFAPQKYPVLGVCKIRNMISDIEIDPVAWNKMSGQGKEQLIYHELGHCALGRPHDNRTTVINNVKVEGNIMYPYFFGEDWNYIKYREQYKIALKNNDVVKE